MMSNKKEGCKHEEVTLQFGEVTCKRCGRVLTDEIAVVAFK